MDNEIIETALAFIGIENTQKDIAEFYDREFIPIKDLAESIGIIIAEDLDEHYVQEVNGKVYLSPGMEITSEFDAALSVGAFLLYESTPVELNSEQHRKVSLFAITTIIPGLKSHISEEPTIRELIEFSRTTKVPFNALKLALM